MLTLFCWQMGSCYSAQKKAPDAGQAAQVAQIWDWMKQCQSGGAAGQVVHLAGAQSFTVPNNKKRRNRNKGGGGGGANGGGSSEPPPKAPRNGGGGGNQPKKSKGGLPKHLLDKLAQTCTAW